MRSHSSGITASLREPPAGIEPATHEVETRPTLSVELQRPNGGRQRKAKGIEPSGAGARYGFKDRFVTLALPSLCYCPRGAGCRTRTRAACLQDRCSGLLS